MTILGFDTSMPVTAACVLRDDGRGFSTEPPDSAALAGPPEHSAELLPTIARLLEESGTGWRDLESIAVGIGPGTFTGLRIGVATARGLAQALGLRLRPVPSLQALAAGLAATVGDGPARPLVPLIDARRRQVFAALYRPRPDPEHEAWGVDLELEWGPEALAPATLIERLARADPPPLAAGDWALESRADLESAGIEVPPSDSGLHAVNALQVCRLAANVEAVEPEQVKPIYVRLPDAEINKRSGRET
jgi:tRNA threonylcarbamoyladenosine biosynthesis protein TsaB